MVHNVDNLKKFLKENEKQLDQLQKAIVNFKQAHELMTKNINPEHTNKVL
jgi:hypothetical protein